MLTGEPEFDTFKAEAASLHGSHLDFAVALSHLDDGVLHLFFSMALLESVFHTPIGGKKELWNPSSNKELANRVLKEHEEKTGEKLSNINLLVEKILGSTVDLLRIKHPAAHGN